MRRSSRQSSIETAVLCYPSPKPIRARRHTAGGLGRRDRPMPLVGFDRRERAWHPRMDLPRLPGMSAGILAIDRRKLPGGAEMHEDCSSGIRTRITEEEFGDFRITIPSPRIGPMTLFLILWLCAWALGEYVVGTQLATWVFTGVAPRGGNGSFLVIWLTFWTIAGFYTFSVLAWSLAGREVIVIGDEAITLTREVSRLRRSRWLDLAGVRNLRYAPEIYHRSRSRHSMSSPWNGCGVVAFDHGSTTYRFGDQLAEIEARRLIATIQERFKIPEDRAFQPLPVSR